MIYNKNFKPANENAFTLAEVLITLFVIGVVAAMTLPTLFHNITERVNASKISVFNAKFIEGLNSAKAGNDMGTQFKDTYDFLKNGLSRHIRMSQICKNDELNKCFNYPDGLVTYEDNKMYKKTVSLSSLKTANSLHIKDSNFADTAAFVMGDGTPVLLTYNLQCSAVEEISKAISPCVAGLVDINGSRKPNIFLNRTFNGKSQSGDLRSINGASPSNCTAFINDLCVSKTGAGGDSTSYMELDNLLRAKNPEHYNYYRTNMTSVMADDYCKSIGGRLPTLSEMTNIASELYGEKMKTLPYGKTSGGQTMKNKTKVYQILNINDNPDSFEFWLQDKAINPWNNSVVFTPTGAYHRDNINQYNRTSVRFICVGN